MDKRIDLVVGLGVVSLGIWVYVAAGSLLSPGMFVDPVGPSVYPRILATGLVVLGLLVVVGVLRTRSVEPKDGEAAGSGGSVRRLAWMIGLTAAYVGLLSPLGYLLATILFTTSASWMLGMRRWLSLATFCIGLTAVLYVVFQFLLGIQLPPGQLLAGYPG